MLMLYVKSPLFYICIYVIQQLFFKNFKSCDARHRVVRKVMSRFGLRRRHLSQSLHTLPVQRHVTTSACGDSRLKNTFISCALQTLHSRLDAQFKNAFPGSKTGAGSFPRRHCMSLHVQSHSSLPPLNLRLPSALGAPQFVQREAEADWLPS